ncbi:MAG: DUF3224 domain-containing protein [Gaiellaceae bacterium]
MTRAAAPFVNERFDPETYDERGGTSLGRIHITRRFEGDLEGEATAELLTATTEDGSAAYVAFDRVTGTLHGRTGSFVLEHRGIVSSEGARTDGCVVPSSGTGDLAGLRGEATINVDEDGTHRLILDYELPAGGDGVGPDSS